MKSKEYILNGLLKFRNEVKPSDVARVTAFKTKFLDDAIEFVKGEEDIVKTAEEIFKIE